MQENTKPKYQVLKEHIIENIKSQGLVYGQAINSENELAESYDISRHTVRQAIGELVNEGWLYRVHGKGTFVGKSHEEKPQRTLMVGVITTSLNDYIFPSIIRGIDNILSMNGYNIMLSCTDNQHEKEHVCLNNFKNQQIDGIIVEPTKSILPNPNIDLYRELISSGIPVLFIHGNYKELEGTCVLEDDLYAGYIATKHLIELGHTDIAGVFKIDDIQGHSRFEGFRKAHQEADIKLLDSKIIWFSTDDMEDILLKKISYQFKKQLKRSTAVVCYNDQIAIKVMDVLRNNGLKIPDDMSLVSFDDSQLAIASEVKLTTVAHPKEKLGEEAARQIIEMMEHRKETCIVKMQPELIIRGSTKRIEN